MIKRLAAQRIAALRQLMAERGMDGYIVPSGDAHASEYAADYWNARAWVSGFTGSAGLLVVLPEEAGLWTDGRYFIQAERELQNSGIDLYKSEEPGIPNYRAFLADKLPKNGRLGFDGRVLTSAEFTRIKEALQEKEIHFVTDDLVDLIWEDRPRLPNGKAFEHELKFAGKTTEEKLNEVRAKMKEKNISVYLVTALDCVAWLLNIRGNDIQGLPVVYSYALITENEAHVFISREKISNIMVKGFTIHGYDALPAFLKKIKNETVFYNPNNTNVLLEESIVKKEIIKYYDDIIPRLKAVKNETELANIKNAFIREGAAMVKTLYWLDTVGIERAAPKITENAVVRMLENFRKQHPHYLCDSFQTIAAYGENAAAAHYNCGDPGATLHEKGFLLIDTGGQYLDGTTDTTRTVALGALTDEMKRDFTLVLKGHIALARAVFLKGTTGMGLDILARLPILESGQNYSHGTGHGVGYCLSVHEGPHNISHRPTPVALVPGMLVTNEPAIYKEGHYGIRTENVLCVIENGEFLSFETLTHCPIDTRAIVPAMLSPEERDWLHAYHERTYETLSPHLTQPEREWLKAVCGIIK